MLSETRRPLIGRIALGALAVGASVSLTACGQLPLLPPALTGGGQVSPEPAETETTDPVETEAETTPPAGPEDTDVFDISLGDCMNEMDSTSDSISEVPKIDCAEPHDYEVYHVEDITESGAFPGEDEVISTADTMCEAAFEGFVGIPYLDSALYYTTMYPTAEGWAAGDREVLCLIYEPDTQVENTLAGSAR